jgi:RNA polymerase-binding transcription factor DksA
MAVNVEKLRKRILEEKARLEADRAQLHATGGIGADVGELTDFDPNHPGDTGTETFEREKDVALKANIGAMLAQIEAALAKMDAGTYGTCDRCGRAIAPARIEALPYATLCIDCQSLYEGLP